MHDRDIRMTAGNGKTERRLLLFLKAPERGNVKSRLADVIGEEHACELYKCFVEDFLETAERSLEKGSYDLKICFHPPASERNIAQWLGNGRNYMPQEGKDLGERMKNAFLKSFSEGVNRVVLIGSDLPDLPVHIIMEGFDSLKESDAVIGPSLDGGYYLIGFQSGKFQPGVFTGITWGGDEVFKRTMELFRHQKLCVSTLAPWRDIDTYENLKELSKKNNDGHFKSSRTMRYLFLHDLIK